MIFTKRNLSAVSLAGGLSMVLIAGTTIGPWTFREVTFANLSQSPLSTSPNGTVVYCGDCASTNPVQGGGSGILIRRENGAWNGGVAGGGVILSITPGTIGGIIVNSGTGPVATLDIDTSFSATQAGDNTFIGHNNFTGSASMSVPGGAALPSTCTAGELFAKTGTTPGLYLCTSSGVWAGSGGAGPGNRILLSGMAAICQAGIISGSGWSTGIVNAPTSTCEADGFKGYMSFTAGTAQSIYSSFSWTGAATLVASAWSSGTIAPTTFSATHYCVSSGAISGGSYGNSQNIVIDMSTGGVNTRKVSTPLVMDTTGCGIGDEYYLKITVQANTANFNLVRAEVRE